MRLFKVSVSANAQVIYMDNFLVPAHVRHQQRLHMITQPRLAEITHVRLMSIKRVARLLS